MQITEVHSKEKWRQGVGIQRDMLRAQKRVTELARVCFCKDKRMQKDFGWDGECAATMRDHFGLLSQLACIFSANNFRIVSSLPSF
jgi:hypothetical protein